MFTVRSQNSNIEIANAYFSKVTQLWYFIGVDGGFENLDFDNHGLFRIYNFTFRASLYLTIDI